MQHSSRKKLVFYLRPHLLVELWETIIMPRKLVILFLKLSLKFICHCIPEEIERVAFCLELDALQFFSYVIWKWLFLFM